MRIEGVEEDKERWPQINHIYFVRNNGRRHTISFAGFAEHTPWGEVRFGGIMDTHCVCQKCINKLYEGLL